ncbi:MAG: hypothetical protein ACRCTZ_18075 [Sarcina sp.]
MKAIIYKKHIIAILCLCFIFFSLSIFMSAMSCFNLFNPIFYSFLQNAALLPLILLAAIVEGIYNSIPKEHKFLKFLIISVFLIFCLIAIHINKELFLYATL